MRDINRIERITKKLLDLWTIDTNIDSAVDNFTAFYSRVFLVNNHVRFYLEDNIFEEIIDKLLEKENVPENYDNEKIEIMNKFTQLWYYVPDWRFNQLLCNFFCKGFDDLTDCNNITLKDLLNYYIDRMQNKDKM